MQFKSWKVVRELTDHDGAWSLVYAPLLIPLDERVRLVTTMHIFNYKYACNADVMSLADSEKMRSGCHFHILDHWGVGALNIG